MSLHTIGQPREHLHERESHLPVFVHPLIVTRSEWSDHSFSEGTNSTTITEQRRGSSTRHHLSNVATNHTADEFDDRLRREWLQPTREINSSLLTTKGREEVIEDEV